jgi:hypothetical protein
MKSRHWVFPTEYRVVFPEPVDEATAIELFFSTMEKAGIQIDGVSSPRPEGGTYEYGPETESE